MRGLVWGGFVWSWEDPDLVQGGSGVWFREDLGSGPGALTFLQVISSLT